MKWHEFSYYRLFGFRDFPGQTTKNPGIREFPVLEKSRDFCPGNSRDGRTSPLQAAGRTELISGWNTFLFEFENCAIFSLKCQ